MVARQEIQATCDDIVRKFAPVQVILFGSYAYGTPTENSCVDILVVMDIPKSEFTRKAIEIQRRLSYRFGLDLLVRSPKEIAYRASYNDWFIREITEKTDFPKGYGKGEQNGNLLCVLQISCFDGRVDLQHAFCYTCSAKFGGGTGSSRSRGRC